MHTVSHQPSSHTPEPPSSGVSPAVASVLAQRARAFIAALDAGALALESRAAALEAIFRDLAAEEDPPASIPCEDLRSRVGGCTEVVADLQITLAQAVTDLSALDSFEVDGSFEARVRGRERLASSLLEIFRVSVGLRETFEALERLAAEGSDHDQ